LSPSNASTLQYIDGLREQANLVWGPKKKKKEKKKKACQKPSGQNIPRQRGVRCYKGRL